MRLIQGMMLFSTCVLLLAACGEAKPSESDLKSGLREFIDKESDQFRIELPLNNTRLNDRGLTLDLSRISLDFAPLQIAANHGKLKRTDESLSSTHYQILGGDQEFINRHPSGRPTLVLGHISVHEVIGFTESADSGSIGETVATVAFRNSYADWLNEDDIQALRNWTAIAVDQSGSRGENPAFRSYPAVFSEMAFVSVLASLSNQGIFSLPQENVYWSNLALESFSMRVPFLRTDEGWTPEPDLSRWQLQEINGLGNLTRESIENAVEPMLKTIVGPITKAKRPSDKTIMAVAQATLSGPMLYQTPFQANGELACVAEHTTDLMGRKKGVEYSCNSETIKQLETMISNGHVLRSVPRAGEVRYALAHNLRQHLKGPGQLEVGIYEVSSVENGSVVVNPNGFSTYRFQMEVSPSSFSWASPYLSESQKSGTTMQGNMVYANERWVVANQ